MKTTITFACLLSSTFIQVFSQNQELPHFSLSINPIGVLFYGPTVDLNIKTGNRTALHANYRATPLSLAARWVKQKDDEKLGVFKGGGFGLGMLWFRPVQNRLIYFGAQIDYDRNHTEYSVSDPWKWFEDAKTLALSANGGYRFKLGERIFLNTGLDIGLARSVYHWDYSDPSAGIADSDPRNGIKYRPIGMLELALGVGIY